MKKSLIFAALPLLLVMSCGKNSGTVTPVKPVTPVTPVTPVGALQVTTFAGDGIADHLDGTGTAAEFNYPIGITTDKAGNVFVSEGDRIRKVTPAGVVTTYAGDEFGGYTDGTALTAEFFNPEGLAFDPSGNLFVGDNSNLLIREINLAGTVSTYAGVPQVIGYKDGPAKTARLGLVLDLVFDKSGNLYFSDASNFVIRKITPAGVVSTFAGDGKAGFKNGPAGSAEFKQMIQMAFGPDGNLYVGDPVNKAIRMITPQGVVSTFATYIPSSGTFGGQVVFDSKGNLYTASGNTILKFAVGGSVPVVFAGDGVDGHKDGDLLSAEFTSFGYFHIDASDNFYIVENFTPRIRKIALK